MTEKMTTADSATGKKSVASNSEKPKKTVYQMIAAVAAELAQDGIAKNQRNTQGSGYNFRGIDDVYNALGSTLARHGLVVLPRCMSRDCVERISAAGKALFYITVEMEFDFVSSDDGSTHTVRMYGEAMDSGDKATNKAMSAAYKYAAFQTFCIPTAGDNDADAHTHEVKPKAAPPVDPLTSEQIAEIEALAKEVGADTTPIIKFYGVKSLSDVSTAEYPKIVRSLEKKRPAPAPAAEDAPAPTVDNV